MSKSDGRSEFESLSGSWGTDGEKAGGDGVGDMGSGAAWARASSNVGPTGTSAGGRCEIDSSNIRVLAEEGIGCVMLSIGEGNIDVPSVLGRGEIEGPGWSRKVIPVLKERVLFVDGGGMDGPSE